MGMKKYRLNKIKRIRRLRDSLLKTDNLGRCTTLLMKMPNVSEYGRDCHDSYYGSGRRINLWLKGGYEYSFSGYESLLHYAKQAGKLAYMEWIKKIL